MLKVSHAKPLHDATAQMTDEAVTHRPQTTTIAMDAKPTKRSYGKGDSSFCRTALLGFAIRVDTLVNMKEGDNQRDQGEGLPPLSLSLRFSPSWLPLSLPIPTPRRGVG